MKKILYFILLIIGILLVYVEIYGNFHKIDNNVYRSAQLNSINMPVYINLFGIKSILNLRGESKSDWYQIEKQITQEDNVSLIDFDMWSGRFYDYNQTSKLVEIIKNAPKPLLIHCIGGSDRTSLASALYLYGVNQTSQSVAREQLSWYYGHLPTIRPHVLAMDKSFDNYVKKNKE